jgi:hypothetical protein
MSYYQFINQNTEKEVKEHKSENVIYNLLLNQSF